MISLIQYILVKVVTLLIPLTHLALLVLPLYGIIFVATWHPIPKGLMCVAWVFLWGYTMLKIDMTEMEGD